MSACEVCGKPSTQWAHRINQNKANLKKYGTACIHHRLNLAPACSLSCNSAVSISNHPLAIASLLVLIYEDLAREQRARVWKP